MRRVVFAFAASAVAAAAMAPAHRAAAAAAAPACTDYRYTDSVSGRAGTVCLPADRAMARGIESPVVWCRGTNCIVTGARTPNPKRSLGQFSAGAIDHQKSGDDVCIEYKYHNPHGGGGTICLPMDINSTTVVCVAVGSGGSHCVVVEPL